MPGTSADSLASVDWPFHRFRASVAGVIIVSTHELAHSSARVRWPPRLTFSPRRFGPGIPRASVARAERRRASGRWPSRDLPRDEPPERRVGPPRANHTAIQAALSDGKVLLEVEVPVTYFSGVVGVGSGDSIAISEYNANMTVLRKIVKLFEWLNQAPSVRVFFPDAAECSIALKGAGMNPVSGQWAQDATFHDYPGPVDYLLRDDFLSQTTRKAYGLADLPDFLAGKTDVEQTAETGDRLYVVGYPYDNSSEMEQVMELWNDTRDPYSCSTATSIPFEAASRPGARRRSSSTKFVPEFESAFYVHKFAAGQRPGLLYRAYPGPWRVYRALPDGGMECVAEYDERPELRDVAMQFFSGGLVSSEVVVSAGDPEELSSDNTRYYELLGVVRDCDRKAINAAYREAAKTRHPDVGGDAMDFYELSKAFAVLRDDEKRAKYDRFGERWVLEDAE